MILASRRCFGFSLRLGLALVIFAYLSLPALSQAGPVPELGVLLTTPAERLQVEALRHLPAPKEIGEIGEIGEIVEQPLIADLPADFRPKPEPAPLTRVFTLHGLVRRADGRHIFWLNQANNLDGVTRVAGAEVEVRQAGPAGVPIRLPQSAGLIFLRAGQSYDMVGGRFYEAFETPGKLTKPREVTETTEGEGARTIN